MLKDLRLSGVFYDETLSVHVTMENPADYGLEATELLFSVMVRDKTSSGISLRMEDFTFYVMDETNYVYNTLNILTTAI